MDNKTTLRRMIDKRILRRAVIDSFKKLDPRVQIRNPVMFVVEVVSLLTTGIFAFSVGIFAFSTSSAGGESAWFVFQISVWLWFTVLFANFAEALAEGRGKAQADAIRKTRQEVMAKRVPGYKPGLTLEALRAVYDVVPGPTLRRGEVAVVEPGDIVPADGEVIEGIASVDESAMTGESAPVIR